MIVLQIRNTYYENYIFKNKEVKTKNAPKHIKQKTELKQQEKKPNQNEKTKTK
jgi:hypothetical protein